MRHDMQQLQLFGAAQYTHATYQVEINDSHCSTMPEHSLPRRLRMAAIKVGRANGKRPNSPVALKEPGYLSDG